MKAVILAGGLGSRLSEETQNKPKPMVEIGGKPILWHIMKIYASHNVKDFIICCGYKRNKISEYFRNLSKKNSKIKINYELEKFEIKINNKEIWNVRLVNTGLKTLTGGRLKRVSKFLKEEEFFFSLRTVMVSQNLICKIRLNFIEQIRKFVQFLQLDLPADMGP